MISGELISMLGGSMTGFLMKSAALKAQAEQDMVKALIEKSNIANSGADAAAKRTGDGGRLVRRIMAFCTLFAVIFAPFILTFFNEPVTIEANKAGGIFGFLFGDLFGKGNGWIELNGYVLLPEVRQCMLALIAYYLGQSAASR